jgi:hypothetical protein
MVWLAAWGTAAGGGDVWAAAGQWPKAAQPSDNWGDRVAPANGPTSVTHRNPRAALGPPDTGRPRRAVQRVRHGQTRRASNVARGRVPRRQLFQRSTVDSVFSQNFSTEVDQGLISKVVDLLPLYNFYKGRMVFFSTVCAQITCRHCCFLGASE